jgi:type I site-specific restriction-modification system R (restriction) subunit
VTALFSSRRGASRELYDLLRDGYLATWRDDRGEQQTVRIAYVDWRDPARNEWLAANQMWIAGDLHTRRVDLVLFVNGIPLVLAEFKEPGRSVRAAYDQLHDTFVDAGAVSREADVQADTAAHLRDLLHADHRYVFTLIHKFRLREGESEMPVLSDRSDVIVITDEAHRTQYDVLAQNMRKALPEAAFMGFTGTPLVVGEELTRREFGDYVSIYNFRDAIADGATVPLFYENRIPELQLVNEAFDEELNEILEEGRSRR